MSLSRLPPLAGARRERELLRLIHMTLTEVSRTACSSTNTVARPASTETQFILDHIAGLDPATGARAAFWATSGMPAALTGMLTQSAGDFEGSAQALAQRLHRTMRSRSRTTASILAVVALARGIAGTDQIGVLKLDMDNRGAQARRNAQGVVTSLELLTHLLPQPGKLSKAMLWPDARGGDGAYLRDRTTGEPAAYFPEAYDLSVGVTPDRAERALVEVVRGVEDPALRRAALATVDSHAGTVETALEALAAAAVPVPEPLPPDLADAGVPVRASRALRRRVTLQAEWLTVTVPVEREQDVLVERNGDGTYTVSATVGTEPERTVS